MKGKRKSDETVIRFYFCLFLSQIQKKVNKMGNTTGSLYYDVKVYQYDEGNLKLVHKESSAEPLSDSTSKFHIERKVLDTNGSHLFNSVEDGACQGRDMRTVMDKKLQEMDCRLQEAMLGIEHGRRIQQYLDN